MPGPDPVEQFDEDEFWFCEGCQKFWVAYGHTYAQIRRVLKPMRGEPNMRRQNCQNCPGWTYDFQGLQIFEGVWYPRSSLIKMEYVGAETVWMGKKLQWQVMLQGLNGRPSFSPRSRYSPPASPMPGSAPYGGTAAAAAVHVLQGGLPPGRLPRSGPAWAPRPPCLMDEKRGDTTSV